LFDTAGDIVHPASRAPTVSDQERQDYLQVRADDVGIYMFGYWVVSSRRIRDNEYEFPIEQFISTDAQLLGAFLNPSDVILFTSLLSSVFFWFYSVRIVCGQGQLSS